MMVWRLTEGLGLMEADIRVLKETDPKKQRASQLDKELR